MTLLDSLRANKGQAGGGYGGLAIGAVSLAVTIIIGLYVFSEIRGSIDRTGFDNASNDTFDTVVETTHSGFTLLAILIIVIVAAAILGSFMIWRK